MKKTVASVVCAVMLLLIAVRTGGQQPVKIPRIGYISGPGDASNRGPYVEALRQGLGDLGYSENKHFLIEYRGAGGKTERYSSLIDELVQLKVDVLVVPTLPAILIAKQASKTIPIVMISNRDPVATGVVDSLARPGGNITGLATLSTDLSGKRLELLMQVVPKLTRLGILLAEPGQSTILSLKEYEAAARALKLQVHTMEVERQQPDLEAVFQSGLKAGMSAMATITGSLLFRHQKQIAELAIKNRLPSMFEGSTWVEAGGLISYSTDDLSVYRRAATYVDKILKGAKPADLPVEQPMKFELVANVKTAKQIGLTIPPGVLARANRVIR